MPKPLKKQFYFMSPVQVVKVTTHNIEQAAEWCGGKIKTTDSRRHPGRTDKYVDVPVPKGAALVMAFPGMYITKRVVISLENEIKVSYAVFRRDYFEKNYFLEPIQSVDACWTRLANEEMPAEQAIAHVQVANPGEVGKALEAARKKMLEAGVPAAVADTVTEELTDTVLTPAQQRMLITGDAVEAATNPETGNVVLPREAAVKHPSLRPTHVNTDNQIVPGDTEHDWDEVRMAGVPINEFEDELPETDEETPITRTKEALADAAQKIPDGPSTVGVIVDPEVVGFAGRHRAGLVGHPEAEGRTEAEKIADEAAFDAEMKEIAQAIEDGDPHR
jgi:hypothetical protein